RAAARHDAGGDAEDQPRDAARLGAGRLPRAAQRRPELSAQPRHRRPRLRGAVWLWLGVSCRRVGAIALGLSLGPIGPIGRIRPMGPILGKGKSPSPGGRRGAIQGGSAGGRWGRKAGWTGEERRPTGGTVAVPDLSLLASRRRLGGSRVAGPRLAHA